MSSDLRFPKTENDTVENSAVLMARESLKRKSKKVDEVEVKKKHQCRACWRCKNPVGRENLTQKWIRRLNAQRFICADCIPLKDEEFEAQQIVTVKTKDGKIIQLTKSKKDKRQLGFIKFKEDPNMDTTIGYKQDADKSAMNLLPFESLEAVAEVLTFGAKKYSPDNWKIVDNAVERYESAMLRHLTAHKKGEIIDTDSGCTHLACMACSALFLVWFQIKSDEVK